MNDKQNFLHRIVETVVACCSTEIDELGTMSVTVQDVLGPSRSQNVNMTRAILIGQLLGAGYSATTCAMLLHRSEKSIRNLLMAGDAWRRSSRAYRIAEAEATLKCRDLEE